jgi:hypothetical protein
LATLLLIILVPVALSVLMAYAIVRLFVLFLRLIFAPALALRRR